MLLAGVSIVHLPALCGGVYFLDLYLTEVHPHLATIGRYMARGELPFWVPELMLGYPLAANPQVGAFYPLHLAMLAVMDADRVIVWSVFFHGLIAAFSVYGLARESSVSRVGSTTAGLAYACCPFFVFYHQALHGYVALALTPLVLLVTLRAVRSRGLRWWALGSLLLACQMAAGHLQFVLYTGMVAFGIAVYVPGHATGRERLRAAGLCVLQGAVALLLYMPQLLAAITLWRHSLRRSLTGQDVARGLEVETLGVDDLLELILPSFFGGPSFRDFWYPEFLGGAAVLAITLCVMGRAAPRGLRFWRGLIAAALAYLVILRIPGLASLQQMVPGLGAFRVPARLLCLVMLAGAVLAGGGVDALMARATRLRESGEGLRTDRGLLLALGAGAALVLAGILVAAGALDGVAPRDAELPAELVSTLRRSDGLGLALAVLALCGAGALAWRREEPVALRAATLLAAAAIVLPVLWVGRTYAPVIDRVDPSPLASSLRNPGSGVRRILGVAAGDPNYLAAVPGSMGWPHRMTGDPSRAGWNLQSNVGMAQGLAGLHGQTSLPLRRFVRRMFGFGIGTLEYPFQRHPMYPPALLAHAGVTHVVAPRGGQMPISPRPPTLREESGYVVHVLPNPRPAARFYPLALVRGTSDEEASLRAVSRVGPTPDLPLVVEGLNPSAQAPTGRLGRPLEARVESSAPGEVVIAVDAPTAGVLLFTEAWFPGWVASTGAGPIEPLPADGCFIGVPLPAGRHRVTLRYHPLDFWTGLPAMGLGLALVLFGLIDWPLGARRVRRPRA